MAEFIRRFERIRSGCLLATGRPADFVLVHSEINVVFWVLRSPAVFRYKSKYKKVGVLPIWIVKSNISSVGSSSERTDPLFLSDEGPTLETLDFTIRIGRTPTFLHKYIVSHSQLNIYIYIYGIKRRSRNDEGRK